MTAQAQGQSGHFGLWFPECSAACRNLNGTTWPCKIQIHFFSVVQNSLQDYPMCHIMEMVNDTLFVLIQSEYLYCQQGTYQQEKEKGLVVSTFSLEPVTELSLL